MPTPRTGRPVGRPPRPLEEKLRLGNPGGRALPPSSTSTLTRLASGDSPKPPRGLGPAGSAVWLKVWSAGASWLHPDADFVLVELLAKGADEHEVLADWLTGEADRHWYEYNGRRYPHPVVKQLRDLEAQLTAWLSMLGFSPSDRVRLGVWLVRTEGEFEA